MSKTKTEQPPAESIRLRENAIVDGKFIPAGEPTPYEREEDLPAALKGLVATDDAPPPAPFWRISTTCRTGLCAARRGCSNMLSPTRIRRLRK